MVHVTDNMGRPAKVPSRQRRCPSSPTFFPCLLIWQHCKYVKMLTLQYYKEQHYLPSQKVTRFLWVLCCGIQTWSVFVIVSYWKLSHNTGLYTPGLWCMTRLDPCEILLGLYYEPACFSRPSKWSILRLAKAMGVYTALCFYGQCILFPVFSLQQCIQNKLNFLFPHFPVSIERRDWKV